MLAGLKKSFGTQMAFLTGVAAGAAAMYLHDPDRGRRRRAMVRDKARWFVHKTERELDRSVRDLSNRVQGAMSQTVSAFTPTPVEDAVLVDRVRAKLGRLVSHPGAIAVEVTNGIVTLKGPVLAEELPGLMHTVRIMRGVKGVENQLEAHDTSDIASLQGGRKPLPPQFELLRSEWAPATRLLVGAAGVGLSLYSTQKRGVARMLMGVMGMGLVTRAMANHDLPQFINIGGMGHEITVQKTIQIEAPVERVFEVLATPERLPLIMSHVQDVRATGEGQYEWTISGPGGTHMRWGSKITRMVPNKMLAWSSLPGATVRNSGVIHFESTGDTTTRVHIQMAYTPPGGELGDALAHLLLSDPKHLLDEELVRLKSLLEFGHTRAHAHKVTLEEVSGGVWVGNTKLGTRAEDSDPTKATGPAKNTAFA